LLSTSMSVRSAAAAVLVSTLLPSMIALALGIAMLMKFLAAPRSILWKRIVRASALAPRLALAAHAAATIRARLQLEPNASDPTAALLGSTRTALTVSRSRSGPSKTKMARLRY